MPCQNNRDSVATYVCHYRAIGSESPRCYAFERLVQDLFGQYDVLLVGWVSDRARCNEHEPVLKCM